MDNNFTVITFNLRFGLADDGPDSWEHRKQGLASFFRQHRSDFIGLQEANDFQISFLSDVLAGYDHIGERSPAPGFWQNNIIFYKQPWRCVHREHFYLSPTPSIPSRFEKSRWPRQCTLGVFTNAGRRLIHINTHFDFDETVQVKSAGLIMQRLARLPIDTPAVLTGDFNASPFSACYEVFTGQNREAAGDGRYFKNIFLPPYPGTYHGFTGNAEEDHIDWILYRDGITPHKSVVMRDTFRNRYPSDHFPLRAVFGWEEGKRGT